MARSSVCMDGSKGAAGLGCAIGSCESSVTGGGGDGGGGNSE